MKSSRPALLALIVDPEPASTVSEVLQGLGFDVFTATTGAEALERFRAIMPALVVMNIQLPDMPGRRLLRQLHGNGMRVPVVVVAAHTDVRTAVEVTQAGAAEFLEKSASSSELRLAIARVLQPTDRHHVPARGDTAERDRVQFFKNYHQLFRGSAEMRAIEQIVIGVADTSATVLIQGETGVGKELVAKALHYLSDRASQPWLKINCASLPSELLESELFGHEKGAFTGAAFRKPGRFELANGGTLLLDEIREMPLALQSKILHVLQDNEFYRVGGRESISVDVRVIAATNKDLYAMVGRELFREDLYYRLNVVNLVIPPLRERAEEIPALIEYFRQRYMLLFNNRPPELSLQTVAAMSRYAWPGNVRELENLIKRYVVLGDEAHLHNELDSRMRMVQNRGTRKESLLVPVVQSVTNGVHPAHAPPPSLTNAGLREIGRRALIAAEAAALREVLERVQWNRAQAARELKINYKTLLRKLKKSGIPAKPRSAHTT